MTKAYNDKLLGYAFNVARRGELKQYNAQAFTRSRICGSSIDIKMLIENGIVVDFSQQIEACSFGSAAASIIATDICGAPLADVKKVIDKLYKMLNHNNGAVENSHEINNKNTADKTAIGNNPNGDITDRWRDLECLQEVISWPSRIPSALLIAKALKIAIEEYEQKTNND